MREKLFLISDFCRRYFFFGADLNFHRLAAIFFSKIVFQFVALFHVNMHLSMFKYSILI